MWCGAVRGMCGALCCVRDMWDVCVDLRGMCGGGVSLLTRLLVYAFLIVS